MLFTEPTFLFLFLPLLLALYFATGSRPHAAYGNWLLLIASVIVPNGGELYRRARTRLQSAAARRHAAAAAQADGQ